MKSGKRLKNVRIGLIKKIRTKIGWLVSKTGFYDTLSDEKYLSLKFKKRIGRTLNLENPQSFNDKIQWLKLHDRNPRYTLLVDKALVKDYIAETIGKEYLIPTIGTWDKFDDIDFDMLPDQFVLKCNHNSGGLVICKDKALLNKRKAKKQIDYCMRRNYFYVGREWPYKNVVPKIIAEPYMVDDSGTELKDYKLMCFGGKVKCSFTCSNRGKSGGLCVNFYDKEWKPMPFERHYPRNPIEIEKPECYEKMVEVAEKLSAGIPFVRVDFYQIQGKPYFGEMTFYPGSGMEEFTPEEWDYTLGEWIELPTI